MGKRKTFSKGVSWLLTCAMVASVLPSGIGATTVKAEEPEISTMLTDLVEVKLGDETQTMQLYMGGYECKFEFSDEEGETSFVKTVAEVAPTIGDETPDSVSEDEIPSSGTETTDSGEDESVVDDAKTGETDFVDPERETVVEDEETEITPEAVANMKAELLINGEKVAEKNVEVGDEDIYFRLINGKFKNSTESDWVKSAAWTGSINKLSITDVSGNACPIGEWSPKDPNAELEYIGGGIWTRTFFFEELEEDTEIEYKIATNDNWESVNWGNGGDNVELTIPAGSSEVTIFANEMNQTVYDSITTEPYEVGEGGAGAKTELKPFVDSVSLIGTVRGDADTWDQTKTGWEFSQISDRYWITQKTFAQKEYAWKVVYKYAKWSKFDDKKLSVAEDNTNVIFLYDAAEDKIYDSINDKAELGEILGLSTAAAEQEVVHNPNDTLKFVCSPVSGNEVEKVDLVYGIYNDTTEKVADTKTVTLRKNRDGSFSSNLLYFGDKAQTIAYYYEIDGVKTLDEANENKVTDDEENEWSGYEKPLFSGRMVTLPGTVNNNGWNPAKEDVKLTYKGNGIYEITIKGMAAGNYEYKIAIDGSWDENYGAKGEEHGDNMKLTVSELSDVTFTYNDISHLTVNSIDYTVADITLSGNEIPAGTKLTDDMLRGIYSATVDLSSGSHDDICYLYDGKTYPVTPFTLETAKKVTFYFDPETLISYNDASDEKVDTSKVLYNSKEIEYKDPYGAVGKNETVKFQIQTGTDAEWVKLVIKGKKKATLDLTSVSGNSVGTKKWSVETTFDQIGEYHYFFAISNGADVSVYSDDEDMNYGEGMSTDLLNAVPYDLIVYENGYETPDWMKNAVIYQIFPERFNNGDVTNDTITSDARGSQQYEYVPDWYLIPENPEQPYKEKETDPDVELPSNVYKGDGIWANDIYGGDLKGITDRIDYLDSLGVTVIYLNPVFESISTHRYDTSDYMNIDPILGTLGDFEELVNVADEHGMKVVLDGVFNHVSDDSVYFDRYYEYLEEGTDTIGAYPYWAYVYDYMSSKKATQAAAEAAAKSYFTSEYGITNYEYTEWFDVFKDSTLKGDDGEVVCDSTGLRAGKPVYGYDGWWGYDSMPIIKSTNGSEYQTGTWAQRVIGKNETSKDSDGSVTQYWLSKGMAGWRLDVANEVSDETWQHFRKSVKALDKDNVIIGEIWTDAAEYLMGDMYDSVMNYMFRNAATGYVKGGEPQKAVDILERLRERYPEEAFYAMMNLVDSHDTARILSYLDGIDDDRNQKDLDSAFPTYEKTSDLAKQKQYLIAFMQFTYAGAPTVYYGDELGMVGADDPDDRRAMIWGKGNKELLEWYATLAKIRSEYSALRTGTVEPVVTDRDSSENVLAYVRSDEDNQILVMMNNATTKKGEGIEKTAVVDLSETSVSANTLTDVVSGQDYQVKGNSITVTIPSNRGVILVAGETSGKKIELTAAEKKALAPGYDEEYIVTERAVKVTGVTLAKKALKLEAGQSATLAGDVTVAPANATNKGVKWYSSNKKVAKVDANGKVTAVAAGTADISVKTNDGQFVAVCTVTVPGKAVVTTPKPQPVGTILTVDKQNYKVTGADEKNPTVSFEAVADKKAKKATIPATIKVGSVTYKVTSIANNAFKGCKSLTKVTIGANIETIGNGAFSGCVKLKSVVIPANVKTIGSKAFYGDKLLKKITIKSTVLKKVGSKAFKGIHAKATIKVPKKQLKAYQKLLKGKGQAKTVKIKK